MMSLSKRLVPDNRFDWLFVTFATSMDWQSSCQNRLVCQALGEVLDPHALISLSEDQKQNLVSAFKTAIKQADSIAESVSDSVVSGKEFEVRQYMDQQLAGKSNSSRVKKCPGCTLRYDIDDGVPLPQNATFIHGEVPQRCYMCAKNMAKNAVMQIEKSIDESRREEKAKSEQQEFLEHRKKLVNTPRIL